MTIEEKKDSVLNSITTEWNKAVKDYRESELLIYLTVFECLKQRHDVVVELDLENPMCSYFNDWMKKESIGKNAMSFTNAENGKCELSCSFDLYELRDLFDNIEDVMFGTIDSRYMESQLDGNDCEISEKRVKELTNSIRLKKTKTETN